MKYYKFNPAIYIWLMPLFAVMLMRLPYFGLDAMNSDEGLYASVARAMQRGGIPYRDAWDHAAPGIFYLYRFAFSIFGDWNMMSIRIIALLAHITSAIIVGFEFRRTGGDIQGAVSATIVAVAVGCYLPADVIAALTETFMLPPLLFFAIMILRWTDELKLNVFTAGIVCAIAIWFKIHALIMIIALLLGGIMSRSLTGKKLTQDLLICVKIMSVAFAAYLVLISALLLRGGWNDFWAMYIKYNIYYMQAGKYDELFLYGLGQTLLQWAVPNFIIAALVGSNLYLLFRKTGKKYGRAIFFSCALLAGLLIGTAGARLFGHYFIPLFAFMGWAAAEGMWIIANEFTKRRLAGRIKWLLVGILTITLLALPLYYFHGYAYQSRYEMMRRGISIGKDYPQLIYKIQEVTKPDELIWIWGFAPEIYVLAKRDCATRFINCNYLVGLIPWVNVAPELDTSAESVPDSWNKLRADLAKSPPVVIVDASVAKYQFWGKYPLSSRPALNKYVQRNYTDLGVYDGFKLYLKK